MLVHHFLKRQLLGTFESFLVCAGAAADDAAQSGEQISKDIGAQLPHRRSLVA
jgi:hypothetical protein